MKKNSKQKSSKNISIKQSMDDVTKEKIRLVDVNGNTLGEVDRPEKKATKATKKSNASKKTNSSKKTNASKKTNDSKKKSVSKEQNNTEKKFDPSKNPNIKTVTINPNYNKNADDENSSRNPRANKESRTYGRVEGDDRASRLKRRKLSLKERRKMKRRAIAAIIVEWVLGLAIIVIGAVLFSFFFCKMENVTIEGSTIYSEEEIKGYVLDGKYNDNCVYNVVHNFFNPKKEIPFIDRAKVTMSGLNTVKITLTERIPLAYIIENDEGVSQPATEGNVESVEVVDPDTGEVITHSVDSEGNNNSEGTTDETGEASSEDIGAQYKSGSSVEERINGGVIKYFNEDGEITDISDIKLNKSTQWTDIQATGASIKDTIVDDSVKLDSILVTLKALKANNVFVKTLRIDDAHNIFGAIDNVKINFGLKNDMDEKCKRLSIILPQLENQSGTLHLENFAPENTDIVFKKEK